MHSNVVTARPFQWLSSNPGPVQEDKSLLNQSFFLSFGNLIFPLKTISFTFYKVGSKLNYKNLFLFSLFGSLIFFIITNFGVWALGSLYEKNLKGLIECYILAIPFFGNTFLSTLVFAYPSIFIHKKVASLSIAR